MSGTHRAVPCVQCTFRRRTIENIIYARCTLIDKQQVDRALAVLQKKKKIKTMNLNSTISSTLLLCVY